MTSSLFTQRPASPVDLTDGNEAVSMDTTEIFDRGFVSPYCGRKEIPQARLTASETLLGIGNETGTSVRVGGDNDNTGSRVTGCYVNPGGLQAKPVASVYEASILARIFQVYTSFPMDHQVVRVQDKPPDFDGLVVPEFVAENKYGMKLMRLVVRKPAVGFIPVAANTAYVFDSTTLQVWIDRLAYDVGIWGPVFSFDRDGVVNLRVVGGDPCYFGVVPGTVLSASPSTLEPVSVYVRCGKDAVKCGYGVNVFRRDTAKHVRPVMRTGYDGCPVLSMKSALRSEDFLRLTDTEMFQVWTPLASSGVNTTYSDDTMAYSGYFEVRAGYSYVFEGNSVHTVSVDGAFYRTNNDGPVFTAEHDGLWSLYLKVNRANWYCHVIQSCRVPLLLGH